MARTSIRCPECAEDLPSLDVFYNSNWNAGMMICEYCNRPVYVELSEKKPHTDDRRIDTGTVEPL